MPPRFFTEEALAAGEVIALTPPLCRHIRVLRLRENESVILFNGNGRDYTARLRFQGKEAVHAVVTAATANNTESPLICYLLVSIIIGQKMDWLWQKAVELGVKGIIPVISTRTQQQKNNDFTPKFNRWQEIARAAAAQSGRAIIPTISPPCRFTELITALPATANKYIFHPAANGRSLSALPARRTEPFYLAFGPEGGWTTAEITAAVNYDFHPGSLGPRILRAETAPLAALSALQILYGDL